MGLRRCIRQSVASSTRVPQAQALKIFLRLPHKTQSSTLPRRLSWSSTIGRICVAMTEPLNHHEALVYVMVASSSVDRAMTDDEFARIGEIVSRLPVFAGCDEHGLLKTAEACGEILSASDGILADERHRVRYSRRRTSKDTRC